LSPHSEALVWTIDIEEHLLPNRHRRFYAEARAHGNAFQRVEAGRVGHGATRWSRCSTGIIDGDLIRSVNNVPITPVAQLRDVRWFQTGDAIALQVERNGNRCTTFEIE
jgi:hypothetical protein